jgi:tRNA-splicing ligase RtcB
MNHTLRFNLIALISMMVARTSSYRSSYQYLSRNAKISRQLDKEPISSESDDTLPKIIKTSNVPIHLFASTKVEEESITQLVNLAQSVIPVGFVAAMPDVHLGKGATVGSVFASDRYISPNAVGVDIGCGMTAIPIKLHKDDLSLQQKLLIQQKIKSTIPTGFSSFERKNPKSNIILDEICSEIEPTKWLKNNLLNTDKPNVQLGTLGGGNHFIEVLYDETGTVS